jgi:hypothetical protein
MASTLGAEYPTKTSRAGRPNVGASLGAPVRRSASQLSAQRPFIRFSSAPFVGLGESQRGLFAMGNEALVGTGRLAVTAVLARTVERSNAARRSARRLCHRVALLAGFAALVAGCVYNADDRCNAGRVRLGPFCACPEGSVLTGQECVPCGENEVAGGTACVCAEGFSRASEGAPCQAGPAGLSAACGAGATCPDPLTASASRPAGARATARASARLGVIARAATPAIPAPRRPIASARPAGLA